MIMVWINYTINYVLVKNNNRELKIFKHVTYNFYETVQL